MMRDRHDVAVKRPGHTQGARRGAVLLLVLVCLVLCASALVSIARQSFRIGADAVSARADLQRRWGVESMNRVLLPAASAVFEERDRQLRRVPWPHPEPVLRGRLMLGRTRFDFALADEDARASVNALYHFGGEQVARRGVRSLSGAAAGVKLSPESKSLGAEAMMKKDVVVPLAFRDWGQVFHLSRIGSLPAVTARLSCWNRMSINVRRASDEAVIEMAATVLPRAQARKMVADYRENRVNEINRSIREVARNARVRRQLERLLSESSVCYSLWVRAVSQADARDSFAVIRPDERGVVTTHEIEYRVP